MTDPVFLCAEAGTARPGDPLVVGGAEAHHMAVQRLGPGDAVGMVDGAGTRALGEVLAVGSETVEVRVSRIEVDVDPELVLVQALAKGGRDERAIEAATELGVTRVIPWESERAVVRWRGPKAQKARASWRDAVTAAAKQARRARIPEVEPLATTAALAERISREVAAGVRVIVLHESATAPLSSPTVPGEPLAPLWLVVGPEGGISDAEVASLTGAGAEVARLGPYILRSSNAGPAAIAVIAALRGAWAGPWPEP